MGQEAKNEVMECQRLIAHERLFALRYPQLASLAARAIERYEGKVRALLREDFPVAAVEFA